MLHSILIHAMQNDSENVPVHLRASKLERVLNVQRKSNHSIGNESIVFLRHLTASTDHLNVKISQLKWLKNILDQDWL